MPTSPRIAPLPTPYPPEIQARLDRLLPPGMPAPRLFATVARNPGLFIALVDSGLLGPTGLFDRKTLPPALRECIVLRTCQATGAAYEANLHEQTIAGRMGLSVAQIQDLRRHTIDPQLWSAAEHAVLDLVDALVLRLDVDDELYARLRTHHDDATLIEITHLVGLYTGVAMLVALARPDFDQYGATTSAPASGQ